MTTRLKSIKQLERKYAFEIKGNGYTGYLDFVLDLSAASSSPEQTFRSWYGELNRKGRKAIALALTETSHNERYLRWAIKYL